MSGSQKIGKSSRKKAVDKGREKRYNKDPVRSWKTEEKGKGPWKLNNVPENEFEERKYSKKREQKLYEKYRKKRLQTVILRINRKKI